MHSVYLLIGSNVGDRALLLSTARKRIEAVAGKILCCSPIYETEAWGKEGLPPHLNQAIHLSTPLDPLLLLEKLQEIELELGRERQEKWGIRTMDIDIIYFDDFVIQNQQLQIPHPLMQLRRFVLIPLAEISPDFRHPLLLKTNKELLESLADPLNVIKYKETTC